MGKFTVGDFVKHRKNDFLIFRVLEASEPPGKRYRCLSLKDDSTTYVYHEDDLHRVDAEEAGVYRPAMQTPVASEVIAKYRDTTYEVRTIVPFGGNPTLNVYVLRHSHVQDFLARCGEAGEFVIGLKGIDLPSTE